MPHFSNVGLLVRVNAGETRFYVFQHPLPMVVDRPYDQTVFIAIAEYILVFKESDKVIAVAKQTTILKYKTECLLYICLFHVE